MNTVSRKGILVLAALCFFSFCFSQSRLSKFQFGVTGGLFIYQGDLSPSPLGSYRTPGFTINAFVNYPIGTAISVRASLAYGKLRGDDAAFDQPEWRAQRAFRFNASILELSGHLLWYPVGNDRKLAPYIFGGPGLSLVSVNRDWSRFNGEYFSAEPGLQEGLNKDLERGLPRIIPVLPVGAGIQYDLSPAIALIAETGYRFSRTDYLDGFSQAANPVLKDHYLNHSIGILFRPGRRSTWDCPPPAAASY